MKHRLYLISQGAVMEQFLQWIIGIIRLHPVFFVILFILHLVIVIDLFRHVLIIRGIFFLISGFVSTILCLWLMSLIGSPFLGAIAGLSAALLNDVFVLILIPFITGGWKETENM